ncbi:MAG: ATP-binding protein [Thermotogaceae bacterium]|nr:ATP-binding protein [Thermotogaceae bacterium]
MIIGYVTGSERTSPYEFYIRMNSKLGKLPDYVPRIGEIVKVPFEYKNQGKIVIYGVITEVTSSWDGYQMPGFEERLVIEKKAKMALRTFTAKAITTRVISEKNKFNPPDVPPIPGSAVYLAEDEEIATGLSFDEIMEKERALPVGILDNGYPAYIDLDYILGENGAHINISGQSGVASKTSYMTFLMRSLIDTLKGKVDPIFIVFNVKGQSLMFLDEVSRKWKNSLKTAQGKRWLEMYKALGIDPKPFENIEFYAVRENTISTKPNSLRSSAKTYWWNTKEFFENDLFELIFDPDELSRNSNLMLAVVTVEEFILERLERKNWKSDKEVPKDSNDLVQLIASKESKLNERLQSEGIHKSTVKLLQRRIQLASKSGLELLWHRDDNSNNKINWKEKGRITVVDISRLRTKMQAVVVGAILKDIIKAKEKNASFIDIPVFILIDELNKYSPRSEKSEIASIFRDVSERGRSFGIILMGAEQTASEVDYRVVTQASTTIVGRQKWVELQKSEYGHLLPEQKRKAATLGKGEMIVDQPFLRIPIKISFPFPAWVLSEKDRGSNDKEIEMLYEV